VPTTGKGDAKGKGAACKGPCGWGPGMEHDEDACMIFYRSSCSACQLHWINWLMANGTSEDWLQLTVEELLAAYEHACNQKNDLMKAIVNGWIQVVDSL
jgi:hypothetical protein